MSYAKTSIPILPSLFERTRLFDLLNRLRDRQAIWIQGQAGAGKTALVAGYVRQSGVRPVWYQMDSCDSDPATFFHYFSLAAENLLPPCRPPLPKPTPESLPNLAQFARLYFRELFARLPKPLLLVFDDIQEIAPDSLLHDVIAAALHEIPRAMNAIVISRGMPPPSLSRMQFNRTLALVDQRALRLTDEEALGLARLWLQDDIPTATIHRMNALVDGWIAGLVLLLEHGGYDESTTPLNREFLFNYFASEIFDTLTADRKRFLLQTACLASMTSSVARELTGAPNAEAILEDLCEHHYFTSRNDQSEPVYEYHPLFRDFLISRGAHDLGNEVSRQIAGKAAHLLSRAGRTEEAIALARSADDWPLQCELITRQAPAMLAQQRFQLLEQWLKQLPKEALDSCPWMHYWFGCCRLPFNQRESGNHFDLAYEGFEERQDRDGMLLSASGAILAIMTEWDDFRSLDPWITALDEIVSEARPYPSAGAEATVVLAMLGALLFRMPEHAHMARWEAQAERLIQDREIDVSLRIDIGNVLVHWQYWKGDLAAAAHVTDILTQLVDAGGSAALPRLLSAMNHAIHDWHTADFDNCLDVIDEGLTLANETGIHIVDDRMIAQGIFASLSRDDLLTAKQFLDRMKPTLRQGRRLAISQYHYLSSNYYLIAGDLESARQHGQIAVDLNREVGTPFPEGLASLTLAQVQFEMGEPESAAALLARGKRVAEETRSRTLELLYELISAWFNLQKGKEEAAVAHLRRGLALQRAMNFLNVPGWRSSLMKPLLLLALDNDIETSFVQQLIRKRDLRTDAPPPATERWPWHVKIYTLGRFALIVDGQPINCIGKAQQKPLELLKVLIASGGRGVGKDRLIEALWPDTEGDKAQRVLDTTLHRFRRLVGQEQVILVNDRKLSLNTRRCWIDVWAVERLLGQTDALLDQAPDERLEALQRQLAALYKGSFLSGDGEHFSIIGYREHLHSRWLSRLRLLGNHWEKKSDWDRALTLYRQMLETDDRQEAIYQHLMACYRSKGLVAEAIATYERCREALLTYRGIPPSPETEALYQSLR